MSDKVFNNELLDDAAFTDKLLSLYSQLQDSNWQDRSSLTEILPPFNNTSAEVPPINDTHSQTNHHFHHNPNSQVLPINDTPSQTEHHFHHNLNSQVLSTLPLNVKHDSVLPKYHASSSASNHRETLFSAYPQMRDWNWQDHNTMTEILPPFTLPFNNTSVEVPPHSQTNHHFHRNPNNQVLPINDTPSQIDHHFHHNPNSQVLPTLPLKVEVDSVFPKYQASSSASSHWTLEEHRLFLEGLEIYGKGKFKSISRHIKTRNPAQVASHSQKYFLRQSAKNKKKRKSIHDITF